jgi:hypothetical protein
MCVCVWCEGMNVCVWCVVLTVSSESEVFHPTGKVLKQRAKQFKRFSGST